MLRKIGHGALIAAIAASMMGATAPRSGYSQVPQKGEARGEGEFPKIRDPEVRPEEAYKYGVQEFAVIASDTGYSPTRIIVRRNIPVRLFMTSASSKNLCFVFDEFSIRKGLSLGSLDEVRFLPTKVGQFKFYCPIQEIEGSIVVRD